jgi:hypothetical protein
MEDERIERWSTAFRQFGELECRGLSDLYERLALGVSDDIELLRWFADASGPRTNANQLFAAVHYLLLRGAAHRLSQFYPTLAPAPLPSPDAYPAFHDFCLEHGDKLATVIRERTTQTNEVSRCTYLLPALVTAGLASSAPLHLIDVGATREAPANFAPSVDRRESRHRPEPDRRERRRGHRLVARLRVAGACRALPQSRVRAGRRPPGGAEDRAGKCR